MQRVDRLIAAFNRSKRKPEAKECVGILRLQVDGGLVCSNRLERRAELIVQNPFQAFAMHLADRVGALEHLLDRVDALFRASDRERLAISRDERAPPCRPAAGARLSRMPWPRQQ